MSLEAALKRNVPRNGVNTPGGPSRSRWLLLDPALAAPVALRARAAGVSGQPSRSTLRAPQPLCPSLPGQRRGKRALAAGDSKYPERGSARRPRPRRALGACQAGRRRGRRREQSPPPGSCAAGQGGNAEVFSARLTDEAGPGSAGRCSGCAFGSRPHRSPASPEAVEPRARAMATLPSAERRAFALKINR